MDDRWIFLLGPVLAVAIFHVLPRMPWRRLRRIVFGRTLIEFEPPTGDGEEVTRRRSLSGGEPLSRPRRPSIPDRRSRQIGGCRASSGQQGRPRVGRR
jgi:hypothetical protein